MDTPAARIPYFQVGGTLSYDAPSYIRRPADDALYWHLKRGHICLVLAPRQSGKSSLMVRGWYKLRTEGHVTIIIDLQGMARESNPRIFYNSLIQQIADSIPILQTEVIHWLDRHSSFSAPYLLERFLETVALPEIGETRLTIFIDEIDAILKQPWADTLFTTIRALYNARATKPKLRRLNFALLGTATRSQLVLDKDRTPFNVGTEIRLADLTRDDLCPFEEKIAEDASARQAKEAVDAIYDWAGGQPFLTQQMAHMLYALPPEERTKATVEAWLEANYLRRQIDSDTHLKFIRDYLLTGTSPDTDIETGPSGDPTFTRQVLLVLRDVLNGEKVQLNWQSPAQERLLLAGMVSDNNGFLVSRSRMYRTIFGSDWIRISMPTDEVSPLGLWLANGRSDDFLLRGEALENALAESLSREPGEYETPDGMIFLQTSKLKEARELHKRRNAELLSEARRLIAEAYRVLDENRIAAIRLALRAVKITNPPTPEALDALLSAVGTVGQEILIFKGHRVKGHNESIRAVAIFPDGERIVTGSWDGTTRVWDARTGKEFICIEGHKSKDVLGVLENELPIASVAIFPDGQRVVMGKNDKTASVWDARTGKEILALKGHSGSVASVAIFPDGQRVVTGSWDRSVRIWDSRTGKEERALKGHMDNVNSVAVFPDGERIVTGSWDETARVWDARTGKEILVLRGHTANVNSVAIFPDGERIVTGSHDKTARVWDARTGKEILVLKGHQGFVASVAIFPDGERIVTGSPDETARVWDARTGKEILALSHTDNVNSVAIFPDGERIVTGSWDGIARVWDVSEALISTPNRIVARAERLLVQSGHGTRSAKT